MHIAYLEQTELVLRKLAGNPCQLLPRCPQRVFHAGYRPADERSSEQTAINNRILDDDGIDLGATFDDRPRFNTDDDAAEPRHHLLVGGAQDPHIRAGEG